MRARLLYRILRPLVRIALLIYFRKVHIRGLDLIPSKGPVILAANHPATFLDAALIACFCPRAIHFMTRGDMMRARILRGFFHSTHQIPVYRERDGFSQVKANLESFEYCQQLLWEERVLLLFVEGGSKYEKRLHTVQKGFAKIAYDTLHQSKAESIHICPVGINYEDVQVAGREVLVQIGESIQVERDAAMRVSRAHWVGDVRDRVQSSLSKVVLDIGTQCSEEQFDRSRDIVREVQGYDDIEALRELSLRAPSLLRRYNIPTDGKRAFVQMGPITWLAGVVLTVLTLVLGWALMVVRSLSASYVPSLEFRPAVRILVSLVIFPLSPALFFLWTLVVGQGIMGSGVVLFAMILWAILWKRYGHRIFWLYPGRKHVIRKSLDRVDR